MTAEFATEVGIRCIHSWLPWVGIARETRLNPEKSKDRCKNFVLGFTLFRWTESLLSSTDLEGKPHGRIGHSPPDVFKQVNLKRLADIVSGQVLDRRSYHDLIRDKTPRGVRNEDPSTLLILKTSFTIHKFMRLVNDSNQYILP